MVLPRIRNTDSSDLCLLGAPLNDAAIPKCLDDKHVVVSILCDKLKYVDAHHELFFLKNCFSVPKLLYILRTSHSWLQSPRLEAIDETIRQCLQRITNTAMDGVSWHQSSLPVGTGGLGIRRLEELELPAFLASSYSTSALVDLILPDNLPVADLRTKSACSMWLDDLQRISASDVFLPPQEKRGIQAAWDEPITERRRQKLPDDVPDTRTKARLLATDSKESGEWLHALPCASLGTFLHHDLLRIAVALRLGARMCVPHRCRLIDSTVDEFSLHALSCRRSSDRFPRHSALSDILRRAFVSAAVPSILEPIGVCRSPGKRPDGMTQIPWKEGKCLVWNATCVDTLATSHTQRSSLSAGAASSFAE